jgi:hypothetical protein
MYLFIYLFSFLQIFYAQNVINDPSYIKTVIFSPSNVNSYAPIVQLNDIITLSFDDLEADEKNYYYKIEHCDFNWNPTNISQFEFVDGYAEYRINNFENSFNTLQPYTHYTVSIPNENTKLKLSGNYRITILNDNNEMVFYRNFVVFEPLVTVGVAIYKSRDISTIQTKQSVEFTINNPNFRINNPNTEIMPVVLQNNNWQTAVVGLKPQFYRGSQLLYKYNKETSFWAGNEFLYFDSKSIRSSSLTISKVELGANLYHTYLYTNEPRINKPYTLFPDINGNFIIRTLEGENANTDADYSWVYFSLESEKFENKEIYINGAFNNWALNEFNKMVYNPLNKLYEAKILMKQGFYNYQFITKDEQGNLSNYEIDGSYFQTENTYTVLVYYNKFGSRYTQVIGVGYGSSERINN